jgi:hypothetical protein
VVRALAILVALTACSVPDVSLEGKQCPCTDGFVCDTLTNRCLQGNGDGGIVDTPAATQCLPSITGEAEIYRYMGTFDWQHADASWSGDTTEIRQDSSSVQNSYTYVTNALLTSAPNVRVIATMRELAAGTGTPELGVVLRAQLSAQDKSRYTCAWSSKDRALRIEEQSGGSSTTIAMGAVDAAATIPESVTMEASVQGNNLACCIRELPTARAMITSNTVTSGYPGLGTNRLSAAFGSFVVFQLP